MLLSFVSQVTFSDDFKVLLFGHISFQKSDRDSISNLNELEGLLGFIDHQEQITSQSIHSHQVVKVALNSLVKFRNNSLSGIDGL